MLSQLEKISQRAIQNTLLTEEATKTSLILPFLMALGYDIFDPTEIIPEYTTDVGTKKGEKVDYAILHNNSISVLIEAKKATSKLTQNPTQLFRYFSVTKARLAILTNGIVYKFYSDFEEPNKMDLSPFFELNIHSLNQKSLNFLQNLQKENWDLESILQSGSEMKVRSSIENSLEQEFSSPSDDLLKVFFNLSQPGKRWIPTVRDPFRNLFQACLDKFLEQKVEQRLLCALEINQEAKPEIETTPEELESFRIIQGILSPLFSPERVVYRDSKKYFSILLDDHNRKVLCRLTYVGSRKEVYFPSSKKSFDIGNVQDLFLLKEEILEAGNSFLPPILQEDDIDSLIHELMQEYIEE